MFIRSRLINRDVCFYLSTLKSIENMNGCRKNGNIAFLFLLSSFEHPKYFSAVICHLHPNIYQVYFPRLVTVLSVIVYVYLGDQFVRVYFRSKEEILSKTSTFLLLIICMSSVRENSICHCSKFLSSSL